MAAPRRGLVAGMILLLATATLWTRAAHAQDGDHTPPTTPTAAPDDHSDSDEEAYVRIPGHRNVPVDASCREGRFNAQRALFYEARYRQVCQPSRYSPAPPQPRPELSEMGDVPACSSFTGEGARHDLRQAGGSCGPVCSAPAGRWYAFAFSRPGDLMFDAYPRLVQSGQVPDGVDAQGQAYPAVAQACMQVADFPADAMPDVRVVADPTRSHAAAATQMAYWRPQKRAWIEQANSGGSHSLRSQLQSIRTRIMAILEHRPLNSSLVGDNNVRSRARLREGARAIDNLLARMTDSQDDINRDSSERYYNALSRFWGAFKDPDSEVGLDGRKSGTHPHISCPVRTAPLTLGPASGPNGPWAFCCDYAVVDAHAEDPDHPPARCSRPEGTPADAFSPEHNARSIILDLAGSGENHDAMAPFQSLRDSLNTLLAPDGPFVAHQDEFYRLGQLWNCREDYQYARYHWRMAREQCDSGQRRACRVVDHEHREVIERLQHDLERATRREIYAPGGGALGDYECLPGHQQFEGDEVEYRTTPDAHPAPAHDTHTETAE